MASSTADAPVSMRKVAFASFVGTAIEFYDFYTYGTAAALVLGGVFFPELATATGMLATFAGGMVAFAVLYGPMFLPELYGTRLRYSGASVSYNLGGVMGGALAPVIAASLLAATGATSLSVSLYILGMAVLSFGCVFLLSETYLNDISGIRSEEGQPAKGTA